MSCFSCWKRAQHTCSREDCHRSICDICLNNLDHVGGSKWVQCQGKFQYYCNVHLVRDCFNCKRLSDGCTKCATKRKRGSFRIVDTCCVCRNAIARCGDCQVILPEARSIDYRTESNDICELEKCYECKQYVCKDCCEFVSIDPYDMDRLYLLCHFCDNSHFPGKCSCWKCQDK